MSDETENKPVPRTECETCHKFWTRDNQPKIGDDFGYFEYGRVPVKAKKRLGAPAHALFHIPCRVPGKPESGMLKVYQGRENGQDFRQDVTPVVEEQLVKPEVKPAVLLTEILSKSVAKKKYQTHYDEND